MDKGKNIRSCFLDDVTDQISCRSIHPSIRRELEDHILDRMEEYEAQGIPREEAERRAVHAMGDPVSIGARLNEIHKIQKMPALTALTLILLFLGFTASCYMHWSPEQYANGYLHYIPGLAVLTAVAWKGYPLLIRHFRLLLKIVGVLYLLHIIISFLLVKGYITRTWIWSPSFGYYFALSLAPVLILLSYHFRLYGATALLRIWVLSGIGISMLYFPFRWFNQSACAVLLLSLTGTLAIMIHKNVFSGKKKRLILITLTGFLLSGTLLHTTASAKQLALEFIHPDSYVRDCWDDTYNSVLIRELLSRTPLTHGLELTPEEMMMYGSGDWYFPENSTNTARTPRYIHYDTSTVTLWDILPQHYHNNYLIAVCIFLFGWIGGFLLLAAIAGFYLFLFCCIRKIRGGLASALSFCCGLLLLFQSIFYVLGNFGYQYASFTNLPLVSEGKISIVFNMILLGFIYSAYRYDRVIEEPETALRKEPVL